MTAVAKVADGRRAVKSARDNSKWHQQSIIAPARAPGIIRRWRPVFIEVLLRLKLNKYMYRQAVER
jgi:hypothetical protein